MPERELMRTYREATGPDPGQIARVLATQGAGPGRVDTPRSRSLRGSIVVVSTGMLAAAIALFLPRSPAPAPAPIDIVAGASEPVPGLLLTADGVGTVSPTRIDWIVGALDVSGSTPVTVVTDDATVSSEDADVRVFRDALGTEVTRRRGAVRVACGGKAPAPLTDTRFCLPVQAAGWLGRANALEARGAPASESREAAEAGLKAGATGSVRSELEVVRIRGLLAEHRDEEALAAVGTYLADPGAERRSEMLNLGIGLADRLGACVDARAWAAEVARPPNEGTTSAASGSPPLEPDRALDRCRR